MIFCFLEKKIFFNVLNSSVTSFWGLYKTSVKAFWSLSRKISIEIYSVSWLLILSSDLNLKFKDLFI